MLIHYFFRFVKQVGRRIPKPQHNNQRIDEEPRRATFGVEYPSDIFLLRGRKDKYTGFSLDEPLGRRTLCNKKIATPKEQVSYEDCDFVCCNFFKNNERQIFESLTFRRCYFAKCFLSSIVFKRIRFESCVFKSCSFSSTDFLDCTLENCVFKKCNAEHSYFDKTEISSKSFIRGLSFFEEHYPGSKRENERDSDFFEYNKNKLSIAKLILTSNISVSSTYLVDESLYNLKVQERIFKKLELRNAGKELGHKLKKWIIGRIGLTISHFNLLLTKGGTSLSRLCLIGVFWILLFTIIFSGFNLIEYDNDNTSFFKKSIDTFLKTSSIFFGFGYSEFKAKDFLGNILKIIFSISGLIWYSLLIPILFRKIYR